MYAETVAKIQNGGESGIRTHEPRKGLLAFEASSFDHSDISPQVVASTDCKFCTHCQRCSRKKSLSIIPHFGAKMPAVTTG